MIMSHLFRHLTILLVTLLAMSLPQITLGLSADKTKPAQFIADAVNYNNQSGVTIFTGHVKMDQGSTHLTGDKVTVYRLPDGQVNEVIAVGNLAHYSTMPDNQTKLLNALAKTIQYFPEKGIAILIKDGIITQGENSFKGPYIVYDIQKQIITSSPTNSHTQSVIVLQPNDLPGSHKVSSQ